MENVIKFGPAGNSDAFYAQGHKHTYEAPAWLHSLGLNAFEYSFGRGARLKEETGAKIAEQARQYGITMSVHAPYYINLANDGAYDKNLEYFVQSSMGARYLGAGRVVFHAGAAGKMERTQASRNIKRSLLSILGEMKKAGFTDMLYCPETMGKINQMGDLAEIIELAQMDDMLYPTIDFGHMNARTGGGLKTEADYAAVLDEMEKKLGGEKYRNMHIHFSHIEYTKMGEKTHLTFEDETWGPFFGPLGAQIKKRGLTPTIICESKGTQALDAVAMKKMYEELRV